MSDRLKVIFAEDDEIINELYQIIIDDFKQEQKQLIGLFCFDGESAISVIKNNPDSLIFCDNALPGISGCGVFKEIVKKKMKIKDFYLVTGLVDEDVPPVKIIPKPFDFNEIKKIIEKNI